MPNYDAGEFIAGPANHYWMPYDKTADLAVLSDTTQDPNDLVPGLEYMGDTQAATTITPNATLRERKTQQHGVVANSISSQGATVATSYAQVTLDRLAAVWHCSIGQPDANGVRTLRPLGKIRYFTLVVDGPGVEDEDGDVATRRLVTAKVANTGEVALTYDDENDTLLEVTWTAFPADNTAGDPAFLVYEGPSVAA